MVTASGTARPFNVSTGPEKKMLASARIDLLTNILRDNQVPFPKTAGSLPTMAACEARGKERGLAKEMEVRLDRFFHFAARVLTREFLTIRKSLEHRNSILSVLARFSSEGTTTLSMMPLVVRRKSRSLELSSETRVTRISWDKLN